ncbi:MAG TPA: ATP-grasp domain-containing protein, partial [Tepidisphaeraceae bacterium]
PEGVSSIPESISSTPEGIRSIPESISSTPKGISSTPKGVSSTPKGLSRASDGIGSASVLKNNASSATDLPSDVSTPAQSGRPDGSNAESREDYELYTSACFEPSIDYVVIKIPRWTFEKFPDADETLTTQMKSVGEAMAIGRTFKEALQKGIRSMEVKRFGFGLDKNDKWLASERVKAEGVRREGEEPSLTPHASTLTPSSWPIPEDTLRRKLAVPSQGRLYYVRYALKMGWTIEQIHGLTHIDPWFLAQMKELTDFETVLAEVSAGGFAPSEEKGIWRKAKQLGYSDIQLASISKMDVAQVRGMTKASGARPVYKLVDTCAAEFEAATPYYYSTYETPYSVVAATPASPLPSDGKATQASRLQNTAVTTVTEDEIRLTDRPKIIIIGGGPNRIGQGIEFDYCCVQAAFAMKEMGFESVMINSNPETVSTDYDTSDLLFFEPLTHEDVLNVCERLNGRPFDDSPEIDLVDGAKPAHEAHLVQLRRYFRETGFERIACVSVTHGQPHEITSDLDVPATNYNFVDDRGELWCAYFEDRNPHSLWGFRGSHFPSNSPEIRAAMKTRFEGKLKPNKGLVKGVVVQYGGQTPLNLAQGLVDAGVPILGTPMDSLDKAGSRERFRALIEDLELKQPPNGIAKSVEDARRIAAEIGYPVMVRPSFVLGGRAMEIVSDEAQLNHYMANAIDVSTVADAPILIDKFLDNAVECDVDCIADFEPHRFWPQIPVEAMRTKEGRDAYLHREYGTAGPDGKRRQAIVIGVMEHIEEAGIHSGDSACALPPYSLSPEIVAELKRQTKELARALHVKGLMNVQYAIKNGEIYLIEVNPRASRTVPFVGKATGVAWAHLAAKVMAGATLDELGVVEQPDPKHVSVKEVVFPFSKFPGVDVILGPEMRSTGEVMGIDDDFAGAYAKAQMAANAALPTKGTVYISVNNEDKAEIAEIAKQYEACGFDIIATGGTYDVLTAAGIKAKRINKLAEGRPNIRDAMKNGQVQLLINTPTRKGPGTDEGKIRALAVTSKLPVVTTLTAAKAAWQAIAKLQKEGWSVTPLQAYHAASPVK